jgi:hypothetical protein
MQNKGKTMDYRELMTEAAQIFNDRHAKYGDMQIVMERVSQLSTLITGLHLTPHDVALVLLSVKLARMGTNRMEKENYVDGINYFAFAGDLIDAKDTSTPMPQADDDLAKFAEKYAPNMSDNNP